MLLGNGDGTFQPQVTYAVGSGPSAIVAGDFTGDGHLDLAVANTVGNTVSVLLGNGDGTFQPQVTYAVGDVSRLRSWRATSPATASSTWPSPTRSSATAVSVLLGNGDGTFVDPGQFATTPYATPLVADVNGDGTDDVLVVDGVREHPLSPGHPRPARLLPAARHGQPRLPLARHRLAA